MKRVGRGRGRGSITSMNAPSINSSLSSIQVDSVGVGESTTPSTPVTIGEEEKNQDGRIGSSKEDVLDLLKAKERSEIWVHFTKKFVNDQIMAACNHCDQEYRAHPTLNGTTSLKRHLPLCKKYAPNIEMMKEKKQKIFSFHKVTKELGTSTFSNEHLNRLFAEWVIMDEQPFNMVNGLGFQKFMGGALPLWKIPCRQTVAKDVFKVYLSEKEKLMSQLKGKRVCLTTDTWTSIQNINYMVVTTHFIDDDWVLHKRILNFCVIDDHKGESISTILDDCISEWRIEKILTVTVDNASANEVAIRELVKKLDVWGGSNMLLDGGKHVHMRCIAHILNLIVNDGLKQMTMSIDAICNAVRYVRSSPQRLELFKQIVEKVKIESKGLVVMDVPTRWNSTYLMLESALKFQKAFDILGEQDIRNYGAYFRSGRVGPPLSMDWRNAEAFSKFLKPFYEVTLRVCCSDKPIVNHTFNDLLYIQSVFEEQRNSPSIKEMEIVVPPMVEKYKKYWGDFDDLNQYVLLGVVLDPRQKFEKLCDYLEIVFGDGIDDELDRVNLATMRVKDILYNMYKMYENEQMIVRGIGEAQTSVDMVDISLPTGLTEFERKMKEKELKRKTKKAEVINNDLDRYIKDPIEGDDGEFHILDWWKVNGVSRYPIVARIAKDILAIPVSTISSESSFSTSGRIINPHRCSLSTKMVQALICAQSWLRGETIALDEMPTSEEMEMCEEAEKATKEAMKATK